MCNQSFLLLTCPNCNESVHLISLEEADFNQIEDVPYFNYGWCRCPNCGYEADYSTFYNAQFE